MRFVWPGAVSLAIAAAGCALETVSSPATTMPATTMPATTMPATTMPATTIVSTAPIEAGSATATTSAMATTAPTTTSPSTTTVPPTPPPVVGDLAGLELRVEHLVDVWQPTGLAWRDGDDGVYITLQHGEVHRYAHGELELVLDLSDETTVVEPGSERGLLGIDFDPRDGRMLLNFTGRDDHTRVVSFELDGGAVVDDSRREVLLIEQPGVGHNGGRLVFDVEGHLFIGSGDGGASNGRDAQDPTELLGAILRILPDSDGDGYGIPPDNPFADGVEDRPEVWVRGLRNPWGFSLDEATGDLWIGDVGTDVREEINVAPTGGLNFGWYFFEGTHQRVTDAPNGLTPPVHEYPRSEGIGVIGGYVYRGSAIPDLEGAYVFGDLNGKVWAMGEGYEVVPVDVEPVRALVGWGEDPDGELYLLSLYDGVYRIVP